MSPTSAPPDEDDSIHADVATVPPAMMEGRTAASSSTTPIGSSKASNKDAVVGDGSFEALMKERTKVRKEKEEHCLAELRVSIAHMDRALSREIKRRIASTHAMECGAKTQMNQLEERLVSLIDERANGIMERVEALERNVHDLQRVVEEETVRVPSDIQKRGVELQERVSAVRREFTSERNDRLSREGRIMKQLSDHADTMSQRWNEERHARSRAVQLLHTKLDQHSQHLQQTDANFESLLATELTKLRHELETERNERRNEDDEIVAALNRYTNHLQSSLSIISSVDDNEL